MIKKLLKSSFIISICFLSMATFAQTNSNNELIVQKLTYAPELSSSDSYEILENPNNKSVTDKILLEMNKHRRFDVSVNWEVEEEFIITLFPFKQ